VPETAKKNLLGVPDASYVRPLLYGLPGEQSGFELLVDFPSQLALKLQQRTEYLRCAFLSPIDYARHGGDYLIVPGAGVSSSVSTGTIQLFVNKNVRNIDTLAVDIRVTSEIILAKIILAERYPNLSAGHATMKYLPMLGSRREMLQKADAALVVNFHPVAAPAGDDFALDLVEEWSDMTGLPYIHGIWVGHDEPEAERAAGVAVRAMERGMEHLGDLADDLSASHAIPRSAAKQYLAGFSYGLGEQEQESLTEFIRFAFFYGILPDAPELNFFALDAPADPRVN
jgi:predicted solute-binding protein